MSGFNLPDNVSLRDIDEAAEGRYGQFDEDEDDDDWDDDDYDDL